MTDLIERLERTKNGIGLVGTRLNFLRPKEGKGISENITLDWREVTISVKEGLDLSPDDETRRYLDKEEGKFN